MWVVIADAILAWFHFHAWKLLEIDSSLLPSFIVDRELYFFFARELESRLLHRKAESLGKHL